MLQRLINGKNLKKIKQDQKYRERDAYLKEISTK